MDGFAGDGAGRFKMGDFIKFASHDKVYMVVADVTSSSNAATVTIEPPLVADIANDSAVTYDNVPFTVHLVNDIQSFGLNLKYFDLGEIQLTDNQGLSLGIENPKELSSSITYSRRLTENIGIGSSFRYIWLSLIHI